MKAHIFVVANPKFLLQILCSFGDMTKNVKLIGIPENNFLCIFIIASSPGVHTFFCFWRVNKKLPQGETSQTAFIKVNQLKVKNIHVKMGIPTFNFYKAVQIIRHRLYEIINLLHDVCCYFCNMARNCSTLLKYNIQKGIKFINNDEILVTDIDLLHMFMAHS